ncbi:hypothetical protein [Phycicoccus sp. Root101]|uniref:hypothetical protein n=1 Tax=Phycicoccus sp. Root101 TaxID=1736421 RepID=UPI0007039BBA|nr:hypothetical protein [Phycicoccus sp. Root101]KQU67458.1 hypothetical protein ASC58_12905 [Phycicoccus sp. Root101]
MNGFTHTAVAFALLPGVLNAMVLMVGVVVVGRRMQPDAGWAHLGAAGFGLLLLGVLTNLTISGSIMTTGRMLVGGSLLINALGMLAATMQLVGLGLLVAAVVSDRSERTAAPATDWPQDEE